MRPASVFTRLPTNSVPPDLLRHARMARLRAILLGITLHLPLAFGVVALLEMRFAFAAIGLGVHILFSLFAAPGLALLPLLPARVLSHTAQWLLRPRHIFLRTQCLSLAFGILLGVLIWAVVWAAG